MEKVKKREAKRPSFLSCPKIGKRRQNEDIQQYAKRKEQTKAI